MRKTIIILLLITFYNCSKTDDTGNVCTSDCTTLQGRFITLNNVGIEGVKVSLKYRIPGGPFGGGSIRYIVKTETDENGYFHQEFYIKDSELGESADGYFIIDYDDSSLDVSQYILSDNLIGTTTQPLLGQAIYSINSRDTIIGNTCYLPKKTYVKINLNNFVPVQDGDIFEVQSLYPFGLDIGYNQFLDSKYTTGSSGFSTFEASEVNNQFNVFVAENENNIIRILKIKNGISTPVDYTIYIPTDNNIELTYEY
ncbi:hypothetical protein [Seonamhaeicola maritimus]|uniref:Uncharacterized protein n=1 Tax=Seonamhaeicola maritimus TaxID=2591822 RepID=A0A5C7GHG4_9FLAO|nr:hypothetical protein [Seonamhaeicola maritimus]TXG36705.1 hypothetical protein FUA22_08980 [Seonamhaeicola maritimus]